jgi:hypothetical protein
MPTRFIGYEEGATDFALPDDVITDSQGYTATRFAPGDLIDQLGVTDVARHGMVPGATGAVNVAGWNDAVSASLVSDTDPAANTRAANKVIVVPAGNYTIDAPLEVLSVIGLCIVPLGPVHIFAEANMEAMFRFNGWRNAQLGWGGGRFWFGTTGGAEVDYCIYHIWDSTESLSSSTSTSFEGLWGRQTCKYKRFMQVGEVGSGTGVQVDNVQYRDILANGAWTAGETTWWQRGLSVGNATFGNNLNHHAYQTKMSGHKNNIYVDATIARFYGGDVGTAEADFFFNSSGYCKVSDFRSEHSTRLYETAGPASGASTIELEQINWSGLDIAADGEWIRHKFPGVLKLGNVQCVQPDVAPILLTNTSGNQLRIKGELYVRGSATYTLPKPADCFSLGAGTIIDDGDLQFVSSNSAGATQFIQKYSTVPRGFASGEATFDRRFAAAGSAAYTSGTLFLSYFVAEKYEDITTLTLYTAGTAAATTTLIRYGVYSVASNGNITLVASTVNDTALLAATNTAYPKALSATWTKTPGTRYAVGMLFVGTTAPTMVQLGTQSSTPIVNLYDTDYPISGAVAGQTDLPASVASASVTGTARVPFVLMTPTP